MRAFCDHYSSDLVCRPAEAAKQIPFKVFRYVASVLIYADIPSASSPSA
jgi:hypothetical protein